jgi:hypothetical protein
MLVDNEKKEVYEKVLFLCKKYEKDFPLFKEILKKHEKEEMEKTKQIKKNEKKHKKEEMEKTKQIKKNEKKHKKEEIEKTKQIKKNEKKLKKEEIEKKKNEKKLKKEEIEKKKEMKKNEKKLKKEEKNKLTIIGKKRVLTKMLQKEERTLFDCYTDIKHLLPKKHHINDVCKYFNVDIGNGLRRLEEAYFMSDLYLYATKGSGFNENLRHTQRVLQAKYVLYQKAFKVIQTIQEGLFWFMCKIDPKSAVDKFLEFTIDDGSKSNNINTLEQVYYYDEGNFISVITPKSNYQFLKNVTCKSNLLFKRTREDVMVYLTNTDLDFGLRIPYFNMKAMDYDSKYKNEYLYVPSKNPNKQLREMWWVWSEQSIEGYIKDLDFVSFTADFKHQLYNGKRFDKGLIDFESDSGVSDSGTLAEIKITSNIMKNLIDDIDALERGSDERERKIEQYENLSNDFSILMLEQQSNLLQKQSQG